jgi:aspartyl-tRNA(Asn)/glutamyl-tRNA(Gln) amidotransferase subunit A
VTAVEYLTARELVERYTTHELSPVEVVEAVVRRIQDREPALNAFGALRLEQGLDEARRAERAYAGRPERPPPLLGVPLVVKDLFDTAGLETTYGSPMFQGHVPDADAAAVRRARGAGAIVLGKTATHEFAWGITSYNAHFDWGRNPWAPDRVSGGSSGGSAVALAVGEAALALGSDTGGSIRVPAAFCGVVGLKPTYGHIDTMGVFPLAPSLDHVGPMARTPADVALLYGVLARAEGAGSRAAGAASPFETGGGVEGLRVAMCDDLIAVALTDDVRTAFESSLRLLEDLGARIVEAALPEAAEVLPTFRTIQGAEALAVHRRAGLFPTRRDEYGEDVGGRLDAAQKIAFDDYRDAALARELLRAAFVRLFEVTDVLLTPVAAGPPVRRGSEELDHLGSTVPFRDLVLPFTTPQDLAGLPACAVRAGFDALGVPIGVQLTGPPGGEVTVLRAADALFQASGALQDRWPANGADGTSTAQIR